MGELEGSGAECESRYISQTEFPFGVEEWKKWQVASEVRSEAERKVQLTSTSNPHFHQRMPYIITHGPSVHGLPASPSETRLVLRPPPNSIKSSHVSLPLYNTCSTYSTTTALSIWSPRRQRTTAMSDILVHINGWWTSLSLT